MKKARKASIEGGAGGRAEGGGGGGALLHRVLRQETEEEASDLERIREDVIREARNEGMPQEIERVALRLLNRHQKEAMWLKQEKAILLAQLERAQKANADLQGRLASSPEMVMVQSILDTSIFSSQLSVRDTEQAKAVVDLLRQIHSLGLDTKHLNVSPAVELQLMESKRNLNRALRCLVLENQYQVNTCISEVIKFTDRQISKDGMEPSIQMVFIEGESLIFRIIDLRLQPTEVYHLCSLDDDAPRGTDGWGFKSLFSVSDMPVIFSPPFQIRLNAAARGPHGVLCPEWVPSIDATTEAGDPIIPPSYRARIKDNCTFVYAPLRNSAKELLQAADMEHFDGLSLGFLDQLRKVDLMLVSYEGPAEVKVVRSLQHEVDLMPVKLAGDVSSSTTLSLRNLVRVLHHRAADCVVRVHKTVRVPDRNHDEREEPIERYYRLHDFQISLDGNPAMGNQETTRITLAFPLDKDQQPLLKEKRKKENGGQFHTESIYCKMPVLNAGKLPFALQADFDLTCDLMGLHPTSAWNHWLLSCTARLFMLSFLSDAKLRDYVDQYLPQQRQTPSTGLWQGFLPVIEGLMKDHMFVKTESGAIVPRLQALTRPSAIHRDFISDALLQEVTKGRKHFIEAPSQEEMDVADEEVELPVSPVELILRCTEKVIERGAMNDVFLSQLWAFLSTELLKMVAAGEDNDDEEEGEGVLAGLRVMLQERLAIYPVKGRQELRRFRQAEIPIFSCIERDLDPTLRAANPTISSLLVPIVDFERLKCASRVRSEELHAALRLIGIGGAGINQIKKVITRLFERQQPLLSDPGRFWCLRSFVVDGLGFPSLQECISEKTSLCVPVLEHSANGGLEDSELKPRLLRLSGPDVSQRLVLPTFLGLEIGKAAFLLQDGASWDLRARRHGALVQIPASYSSSPSSQAQWELLLQWEAAVVTELGIDGGINRNWESIFEAFSFRDLVERIVHRLSNNTTSSGSRRAFEMLLDLYVANYPHVFEHMRSSQRPSNSELLSLLQGSKILKDSGICIKCSKSFVLDCLNLCGTPESDRPSMDEIGEILQVEDCDDSESPEALRFKEVSGYSLVNINSLFAVSAVLHVITSYVQGKGGLSNSSSCISNGDAADVGPMYLTEGYRSWGPLLVGLFRKALTNLITEGDVGVIDGHNGSPLEGRRKGRKRKRSESQQNGPQLALLEAYCRNVGVWLPSKEEGQAGACYTLTQVIWSTDDPIMKFMSSSSIASSSLSSLVVLDEKLEGAVVILGDMKDETGVEKRRRQEIVKHFFIDSLGVTGHQCRKMIMTLLENGLQRWKGQPGPMPRDVEEIYRAIGAAASSSTGLGFDNIPVLTLEYTPAVLRVGNALGGEGASVEFKGGGNQPLVGIVGPGEPDDGALPWFYREKFPARCLHFAVFSLLKLCSPTLLPRISNLVDPHQSFTASYVDTGGSIIETMKVLSIDMAKAVKIVAEVYSTKTLPLTEIQRYWGNISELRDLVLAELWKPDNEAANRNEELIEAVKSNLLLPLSSSGGTGEEGASKSGHVEMVNVAKALERDPVYLESILGIDLELRGKKGAPSRFMRHPWVSRDTTWHRGAKVDEGFFAVEQSCYWERFFLSMGVKPLEEEHIKQISLGMLNKVFLAMAKFNSLLNGPENAVPNHYRIWLSYHHIYRVIDGNAYVTRYKELQVKSPEGMPRAGSTHQDSQGLLAPPLPPGMQQQGQTSGMAPAGSFPPPPLALQSNHSGLYYDYGNMSMQQSPYGANSFGGPPFSMPYGGSNAGGGGGGGSSSAGGNGGAFVVHRQQSEEHSTSQVGPSSSGSVKRQRSQQAFDSDTSLSALEGEAAASKTPRLIPPVPPAPPPKEVVEEGEIEEGEIEG